MKMEKTKLYTAAAIQYWAEMCVWDCWYRWRLSQQPEGYDDRDNDYKVLHSIPNHFDWILSSRTNEIVFTWDGGEERVPLSEFVSDVDGQPDLTMLWHSGYYDGPLSGMAEYNGELVWFDCNYKSPPDEELRSLVNEDWERRYTLYRLSDEDREELCRRHQMFQEMVGYHCDHDPDIYKPFTGNPRFDEFYDRDTSEERDVKEMLTQPIDEFCWHQFKHYVRPR